MLDNEKLVKYFESAGKNYENQVWYEMFRFVEMNKIMIEWEKRISNEDITFVSNWRRRNYKFYSEYVHNSFFQCSYNSYTGFKTNNPDEKMNYNLWCVLGATIINSNLTNVVELFWIFQKIFLKLLNEEIKKEKLIIDEYYSIWDNGMVILLLFNDIYEKKKVHHIRTEF